MVFNRFVSKRSLLQVYKGEIMKVRLDIDAQHTEEQIIIEAPTLSTRVQKSSGLCPISGSKGDHQRKISRPGLLDSD